MSSIYFSELHDVVSKADFKLALRGTYVHVNVLGCT